MDWKREYNFLMAHVAELDSNNIVLRVIVVSNDEEPNIEEFAHNLLGGTWIRTSYNGTIRKNFAGIGFTYDEVRDAFIAPEPIGNLGLDEETCTWIMPKKESQ